MASKPTPVTSPNAGAVEGWGTNVLGLGGLAGALIFFRGTKGVSEALSFHKNADSESLSTGLGVTKPVGRGTGGSTAAGAAAGVAGAPNRPPWANPNPVPAAGWMAVQVALPNKPPVVFVPNKPPPADGWVEEVLVPNKPPPGVDDPNQPPLAGVVPVDGPKRPPPVAGWVEVEVVPKRPPPAAG